MQQTAAAQAEDVLSAGGVFRFGAIGTGWQIDTEHPLPDGVRQQITALTENFDRVWSRFRTDSLVIRIAHAVGGGRFEFPAHDAALLNLYDCLVTATGGAVDPLIGRGLELLGYNAQYTLIPDRAALTSRRHRDSWLSDIQRQGTTLVTDHPVAIDVGAARKGYLEHHLVMLQGDVRWAGNSSDGVVSRRQIAEVLIASLTNDEADHKTFELVAEKGDAQPDLAPVFAALQPDDDAALDGPKDRDNLPLSAEPQRVVGELDAIRGRF